MTLDATRATAVLNAAMQGQMFPAGAIPESDGDKVTEADKIIELALQSKVVADNIGHSNVPLWPVIASVLREAGIDPEAPVVEAPANGNGVAQAAPANPPATQAAPSPEAAAPSAPAAPPPVAAASDMQQVADATGQPIQGSSFTEPPGTEWRAEPGGEAPTQIGQPQAPAVPPAADPSPGFPQTNEVWLDASGNQWGIIHGSGGPQVEVENTQTRERTLVPSGFLKQRVMETTYQLADPQPQQIATEQPPSPSSSPPQQPSAPSLSPTPPPVPAPATAMPPSVPSGSASPEPSQPASPPSASSTPSSTEQEQSSPADQPMHPVPVYDDEGDEDYGNLLEQVTADYTPQFMPAPMDLEHEPAPMPEDLTAIQDIPARALHSQFNALAARARYLGGIEQAIAKRIDRVVKYHMKGAMREARGQLGKDASVTEVAQLAEDNELISKWIERRDRHQDRADAYKTFLSMYSEDVTVLSRDWTMRDREERQA